MKQHIKKSLKFLCLTLVLLLSIKAIALGIRIYAETKTDSWYIFIYKSKTIDEQREMIQRNEWKEVEFEHGRIIVDAPGVSEGFVSGMCKIQFWKDGTGAKAVVNQTIHNPKCKPIREQYAKDHPVLFYIITGRGPF